MENTLNIQLTLNDEQLKDLIIGNINDLPKEKLQDVLLQAIKEILLSRDGQNLFITTTGGGYSYNTITKPSAYLEELISKTDIKDSIAPIVNKAVSEFSANYPKILEKCVMNSVSQMFMDEFNKRKLDCAWEAIQNHN
jgi:hypothetical protein